MTETEFRDELLVVLSQHSDAACEGIGELLKAIPAKARRLDLVIFPAQDGDGFFTIRASVDGPDLFVLNKSISENAEIFDARYTESGVEPPIPIVDPFDTEYEVNDVVVDTAASWLQTVWESLGDVQIRIPVVIVGHDDFGTITPIELLSGRGA